MSARPLRTAPERPIALLVVDIDGCLVPIEHAAYDLESMAELAALNRLSRRDGTVPALTILSGRPHPYVDALMQALDITLPAVFENGAGLARRSPYRASWRAEIERGRAHLDLLLRELRKRPELEIQPGKSASLTVFPSEREQGIEGIERLLGELFERHALDLVIDPAHECVNVLVPGVDKGLGLRWLAEEAGVELAAVAGVGDSPGDLAWLRLCAVSAAPANAHETVRDAVGAVSEHFDISAVLEFYRELVEGNRRLARMS